MLNQISNSPNYLNTQIIQPSEISANSPYLTQKDFNHFSLYTHNHISKSFQENSNPPSYISYSPSLTPQNNPSSLSSLFHTTQIPLYIHAAIQKKAYNNDGSYSLVSVADVMENAIPYDSNMPEYQLQKINIFNADDITQSIPYPYTPITKNNEDGLYHIKYELKLSLQQIRYICSYGLNDTYIWKMRLSYYQHEWNGIDGKSHISNMWKPWSEQVQFHINHIPSVPQNLHIESF